MTPNDKKAAIEGAYKMLRSILAGREGAEPKVRVLLRLKGDTTELAVRRLATQIVQKNAEDITTRADKLIRASRN